MSETSTSAVEARQRGAPPSVWPTSAPQSYVPVPQTLIKRTSRTLAGGCQMKKIAQLEDPGQDPSVHHRGRHCPRHGLPRARHACACSEIEIAGPEVGIPFFPWERRIVSGGRLSAQPRPESRAIVSKEQGRSENASARQPEASGEALTRNTTNPVQASGYWEGAGCSLFY